jgi:hypothetical protein
MTYMRLVICSLRAGWTVPQLALRFTLPWSTQSRWPIFCCIFYISFSDVLSPNVFREVLRKFSFLFLTAVYQRTQKRWYTNCPLFGSIWRRSWNSHHFNHIIRIVTTVAGQVWPLWAVLLSLTWGQPSLSLSSSNIFKFYFFFHKFLQQLSHLLFSCPVSHPMSKHFI